MDEDQLNNAKVEEQDNPALNRVIERNIRTFIHLSTGAVYERGLLIEHELTRVPQQRSAIQGNPPYE